MERGYKRGGVDKTLFIKQFESGIIITQTYVDDIVFGSTFDSKLQEFEMSMVGELTFFLSLQIKQHKNGIFISQSKYARNLVKTFGLETTNISKPP